MRTTSTTTEKDTTTYRTIPSPILEQASRVRRISNGPPRIGARGESAPVGSHPRPAEQTLVIHRSEDYLAVQATVKLAWNGQHSSCSQPPLYVTGANRDEMVLKVIG